MPEALAEGYACSIAERIDRQCLFAVFGCPIHPLVAEPDPRPQHERIGPGFGFFDEQIRQMGGFAKPSAG